MKRLLLSTLAGLMLAPMAGMGAASSFTNFYGYLLTNPQIDATNVVNYGTISTATALPYETWDTYSFTNYGTWIGSSGFRFDTVSTATGRRTPAANFVNLNVGVVEALNYVPTTIPCELAVIGPSYLLVSATNIINHGLSPASFIVGPGGWIQLEGRNVDLKRSGLEVLPVWAAPLGSAGNTTNFTPDIAVYDIYAVATNLGRFNTAPLWNGTTATAPTLRSEDETYELQSRQ